MVSRNVHRTDEGRRERRGGGVARRVAADDGARARAEPARLAPVDDAVTEVVVRFSLAELRALREAMRGWVPSASYAAHMSAVWKLDKLVGNDPRPERETTP